MNTYLPGKVPKSGEIFGNYILFVILEADSIDGGPIGRHSNTIYLISLLLPIGLTYPVYEVGFFLTFAID